MELRFEVTGPPIEQLPDRLRQLAAQIERGELRVKGMVRHQTDLGFSLEFQLHDHPTFADTIADWLAR